MGFFMCVCYKGLRNHHQLSPEWLHVQASIKMWSVWERYMKSSLAEQIVEWLLLCVNQ